MTGKGWTTQMAAAAGAAAGTGAAQLGLGYGLGVVVWPTAPTAPTTDNSVWLGSLGWATWIAASATVFGAVIAARLRGAQEPRSGGPWRFALAASAAVGALLTVALVAVPARSAVRADTFAPEMIAGGYAVIGVVLGLIIAHWAVVSRAVAANLIATAGYLWTLAAAGIVVELTLHRESATYLTSWQFAELGTAELGTEARYGTIYWPSALLTLLAALIIGMVAAWPSVRAGNLGIGTAASGAVGPLLVAAAFLVLAPQLTGALGQLESAYLIAPYAVLVGLAGSALIVASGQRSARRRAGRIARIHQPAPPAATGKAAVPDGSEIDTPPMGLPHVSATTPTQRSGRGKTSGGRRRGGAASAADRTPDQAQAPAAAETAAGPESTGEDDGDQATKSSDRSGRWARLLGGGRTKPSAATDPDPSADPAPTSSGPSTPGATAAGATPAGSTSAGATAAGSKAPGATAATPARPGGPAASPTQGRPAARGATPAKPPTQGGPGARGADPAKPPTQGGPPGARGADPSSAKDRPAKTANRPQSTKSTVAAPPSTPPIAKINPPEDTATGS